MSENVIHNCIGSIPKDVKIIVVDNSNNKSFKGEIENEDNFAKKLASLADIYINDAFSCSHREQASIHKITKFVKKSFAGPLFKREIDAINSVIKNKKKP